MKHVLSIFLSVVFLGAGCVLSGTACDTAAADARSATLSFDSFDGGGPEYTIEADHAIVSHACKKKYAKTNNEELDGAGYDFVCTFRGVKPETILTVRSRSPIAGNNDRRYAVKVDDNLNVSITPLADEALTRAIRPVPTLVMACGGKVLYASLADNASARALTEKLSRRAVEVRVRDYGGFEKAGDLPWDLERNDESITTTPGDIILYQGNKITFYYDRNTWDLTRLGRIEGATRESLLEFFGCGDADVSLWVEWSE